MNAQTAVWSYNGNMNKITLTAFAVAALFAAGSTFGGEKGDHACCAKHASNSHKMCADFASLGVTAEQKSQLEAWQADCTKAGCTKDARAEFLKKSQGILSADQFAKLKAECEKSAS